MKDIVEQLFEKRFFTKLGSGIEGPDGFFYLPIFDAARPDTADELSIPELVPEALKSGAGIVLNPDNEQPDAVFTFGQVWSYAEFGSFFYEPEKGSVSALDVQGDEVTVSNPSADYFPLYARFALRRILQRAQPEMDWRVLHLQDPALDPPDALVFSLFKEDLASEEDFDALMFMIDWHLPPHYSIRAVDKSSELAEHFHPL